MTEDPSSSPGGGGGRPRLLIADDDSVVRAALRAQLAGEFEIVAAAEDADQAITLAEEHRPDAALIDVEMPHGGASVAVPEIAVRSPQTCMVILSSQETPELVNELLAAGAIAYVRKGVGVPEITSTLTSALQARAGEPPG